MICLAFSCFQGAQSATVVDAGDVWQYRKGTNSPQADWKTATSLDATWLTGPSGFGYADNLPETALCQTVLADMKGQYSTLALRRSFEVASVPDPGWHLQLTMDYDDGFVAWLDGVFLATANSPAGTNEPAFDAVATASHESSRGSSGKAPSAYDLGPANSWLAPGTHILAILGLNQGLNSSDFIQVPTLSLVTNNPPNPDCLSGAISTDTTWSASASPFLVCSNLNIRSGATLTIEPGTTVQLGAGANLVVESGGRLLAEGTETNRIHLTTAPGATAWGGLTISGTAGTPETRLAYVDFDGNSSACIEVAGGTIYLDHATFGTTTRPYVSLDSSSFLISHCYFPSSTAPFELLHGTGGIKTDGRGLVRDCFFGTTSGYNDIMDFTGGNRPGQPIIQFYNNVFSGATDDILDLDGTDAWIEGNIFLHAHKNGAPDSAAAVSGGNSGGDTSEITIIGNLFYDCDQAATAKQGNFYTLLNNTIVHMTKTGGVDTAAGAVNVRDLDPGPPTTFGAGFYLEGNVMADVEQLVRNYDPQQTAVSFVRNILPVEWTGPGMSNSVSDPMLKHVPQLAETYFTNWTDAQVLWDWFSLLPGSPALGTGPNGRDQGGVVPRGVSVSGEPQGVVAQTSATLWVGVNRAGNGIPAQAWPGGSGYTDYQWKLDSGEWSSQTPLSAPIVLTNLAAGVHQVAVRGKNDAGYYQDDPALGTNAVVTVSRAWTVQAPVAFTSVLRNGASVTLHFKAESGNAYFVEYTESLLSPNWSRLTEVTSASKEGVVIDSSATSAMRFYRLVAAGR